MTKVKLFPNGFSVKGHCSADMNDEEGKVCVVYTRKDGNYGVIIPSDNE
jgi:hypothetical protein